METSANPTYAEIEQKRERFRADVAPFLTAKAIIYQLAAPTIVISPSGEISYKFSEKEQAVLDQCDKAIADTAERYGVPQDGEDRRE